VSAPPVDVHAGGAPAAAGTLLDRDAVQALRNGAKLGASLVATWTVALGVRLVLPRHLGPETFGAFQFADAITTTLFVVTTLGLETYIRKEVGTRHDHASDFLGGVLLLRLALSAAIVLALVAVLAHSGKPPLVQRLVLVLALSQLFVVANATYAALLHSVGAVNELSVLNVGSKLLWGGGILAAFALGKGVEQVAWALALTEGLKTAALAVLARRHLGVRITIDPRETGAVLAASLPFFLGEVARTAFAKVDVSVMSFLVSDREVGWYAAASNLAGLAMLITPLIGWVLLPLTSRAAARSDEELTALTRRAMELILVAAIPITLLMCLGADVIVYTMLGAAFAPATRSLRILAPMFVLTYVAIISACTLVRLERGWTVTWVLVAGLVASPLLNWMVIPRCLALFGPGGAGVGAAIVLVAIEACMTAVMTWPVARRSFDRRSLTMLGKTGVVCAVVVVLDGLLSPLGVLRLAADGVLYVTLVVAWKAVDVREITHFVRRAVAGRGESYAGAV